VEIHFGDLGDMGGDFSDFFKAVFGGAEGLRGGEFDFGTPRQRRGANEEAEIEITLEEAARGTKKTVGLERIVPGDNGRLLPERSSYTVSIPRGVTEGSRIRLGGQGGKGTGGGQRGDLFLRVHLRPDPRFQVEGHNLRTRLDLAPWEAALGARIDVPALEKTVTVRVPPGTQSGQTLRLRGKGLPRRQGEPGDLLAEVRIVTPKTLTARERELFEQLGRESQFRPRDHRNP
jgi:curved DNA-binding protein